jgi:hypothetical protein
MLANTKQVRSIVRGVGFVSYKTWTDRIVGKKHLRRITYEGARASDVRAVNEALFLAGYTNKATLTGEDARYLKVTAAFAA